MKPTNTDDPHRTTDPSPNAAEQRDGNTTDFSPASALERTGPYIPDRTGPRRDGPPERLATSAPAVPGYQIEGVLGRGGMGVVYKARHLALKRMVALKMILSGGHAGEGERQRFRSEAAAVARLQHPNIVQVYEVGEHEGLPYAALEFIEGGTLAQRLKLSPVSPREAAEVVATLAEAMQLAHSRNIVHRDLKPANILLDANGSPKVTDFGLARQLDSDIGQTQTGTAVGTPSYMSPEQAAGESKHVGPAADVYALGAILYECLTGRPPFLDSSVVATLDMVRSQEPVAPHLLRTGVPADLETICLKCLRKEPEKRYASADALANDLHRWLRGEPIRARPVPMWERVLLWTRRRPALATLFVLAHVFLAVSLGEGIWSYLKINEEKLKLQRMSAGLALDRGLQLCQEGKVSAGMLWMAESLAVNPEEDRGFAEVVRLNLAAWRATLTVQRTVIGHEQKVNCVAYSPDGKTVATAAGSVVRRWDAVTGEPVGQVLVQPGAVLSLAYSPDGRLIATGSDDKTVRIWDVETGKQVGPTMPQPNVVNSVAFSRNGRWLVAATGTRAYADPSSARVWEVATGKPATPPLPHPATVWGAVFTADGRLVITGGHDGVIRYWESATGKLAAEPLRISAEITALAISSDGSKLAIGCGNGDPYVYSISDRKLISPALRHSGRSADQGSPPVRAIAFHPDGAWLATGRTASIGHVWEWLPGKQAPLVHLDYVNSVDFSPDGRRLITGSDDRQARIWDLPLSCQRGIPLVESNPVLALAYLDPSLVAASPRTRISGSQGRPIPHWVWEYLCAAFSPDGRLVITGSQDNLARVWEVATGRLVGKALVHQNWPRAVAFAPDSRRVLTGSHDMTARLWDVQTGEQLCPAMRHASEIVAVAISPDGAKGLTGSSDKTARLWNLNTGEAIGPAMLHADPVLSVCFSDDGRFVLTSAGGSANEVRLWDAATATQIGPPGFNERPVPAVLFESGGRSFLTMGDDGAARRWPMPQPIAGDPDLVRLWTQTITGQELDAGKSVSVLEPAAWRERRERVMASSLRSDLEVGADDVLAWHDNMVGANEISLVGDAALWHLERLLAAHPREWSLHARQAGVLHRSGRDAQALKALALARELGGLEHVRGWCADRAENLDRLHQHEAAIWFREWIVAADPKNPQAHDDVGHCQARLGRFTEASDRFSRAVALAPDRIDYQRDLAMARLALDDRVGFRQACARLVQLAEATDNPDAAYMAALTCVCDAGAVQHWDAVVRLVARAAAAYDGDIRIRVAALFRAGRIDEALKVPFSTAERDNRYNWEWFFQGMLWLRARRHEAARDLLGHMFKVEDFMDQAMPRDAKSKVWSDWIYYVQCQVLRKEAEGLLRDAGPRGSRE